MAPKVCATCGFPLGDKILPLMLKWEDVCKRHDLSDKKKSEARRKLLDELGVPKERYCCRMRLISMVLPETLMIPRR